jgi:hypothetical protein
MRKAATARMHLAVIPADCFVDLMDSASRGDIDSMCAFALICGWTDWVNKQQQAPLCMVCDIEMKPASLGGYVVMVPLTATEDQGVAAAFCESCGRTRSNDQLRQAFRAAVHVDGLGSVDIAQ